MCEIESREVEKGHWEIVCKISGKPITISNDNGMYCEDMCDEDLDIAAGKDIEALLSSIKKISRAVSKAHNNKKKQEKKKKR